MFSRSGSARTARRSGWPQWPKHRMQKGTYRHWRTERRGQGRGRRRWRETHRPSGGTRPGRARSAVGCCPRRSNRSPSSARNKGLCAYRTVVFSGHTTAVLSTTRTGCERLARNSSRSSVMPERREPESTGCVCVVGRGREREKNHSRTKKQGQAAGISTDSARCTIRTLGEPPIVQESAGDVQVERLLGLAEGGEAAGERLHLAVGAVEVGEERLAGRGRTSNGEEECQSTMKTMGDKNQAQKERLTKSSRRRPTEKQPRDMSWRPQIRPSRRTPGCRPPPRAGR